MNNKVIYEQSINAINNQGWGQHYLENPRNNSLCLMGALIAGTNQTRRSHITNPAELPTAVLVEIDERLSHYLGYRFIKYLHSMNGQDHMRNLTAARIAAWNDAPWRRMEAVMEVLESLKQEHHEAWLQDEISQLKIRITNLEVQKQLLEAKVTKLQTENSWLRKALRHAKRLEEDRKVLESLDQQLKTAFEKVEQLETVS